MFYSTKVGVYIILELKRSV